MREQSERWLAQPSTWPLLGALFTVLLLGLLSGLWRNNSRELTNM